MIRNHTSTVGGMQNMSAIIEVYAYIFVLSISIKHDFRNVFLETLLHRLGTLNLKPNNQNFKQEMGNFITSPSLYDKKPYQYCWWDAKHERDYRSVCIYTYLCYLFLSVKK